MNAKTRQLLIVMLSVLLSFALVTGCDDDDDDDDNDTTTDTAQDTDDDTGDDTTDDTEDDTTDDTDDDTGGDTEDDTTDDTEDDTTDDTEDDTTDDTEDDTADMMGEVESVTAEDQTLDDLSTRVTVAQVVSEGAGWMVIHEDDGGAPGPVIGQAAVTDGTNTDVVVELERPAADGETLHAMLHDDDPADGAYTFDGSNGEDLPATDGDGNVIMEPFVVTVPAELAAVRLQLSANGIVDYSWDGVEPALYEDAVFPAGLGDDVAIELTPDWRYEVVNADPTTHPFQLITEVNGMPATDTVLLSEGDATATLEDDTTINWVDDGAGTVQFTASTTLTAVVNAYRCAVHSADMRGEVTVAAP